MKRSKPTNPALALLLFCGFGTLLFSLVTPGGVRASDSNASVERPAVDPELRLALEQALQTPDSFQDRFHAEVWLLDMSTRLDKLARRSKSLARRLTNPDERMSMLRGIHREAKLANLDPRLVMALIEVESAFDRFAISRSGAQGLMQVMPFWLDELDIPDGNLFHLDTNLRMGCTILRFYLDKEKGNLHRALARYNGSLGRDVYPNKVFKARRAHWY